MKKLSRADQASLVESYDFKYLALIDDAKQKIIEELKNQHPELARFITNNAVVVNLYVRSSTTVSGYVNIGRVIDFVISNGTIELVYERSGYTRYVDLESAMTGADAYFGNLARSMPTYKVLKAIKDVATALNRQHKNVTGLRDKKAYKALNDEVAKELKQHIRAIRYEIPMAEEYSAVDMPNIDQEDFDQWAEKAAENLNKIHENFFNLPFAMAAVNAGMVSDRPLFTEKGDPTDTNRNIANSWHAIGKITFDCQISQLSDDAKAVIKASRPTGTATIDNKKIVDCVRLANALIKYFNNDVSFFRDKHMNTTTLAASFKTERQAMTLQEEFKLYESMWESVHTKDWYGADAEVEFETSVYPDIAKYFGLKSDEVVTYAYYYTDEVIVNYDDATGRSHEIEKHVPLNQVEEWFKAGYTILDEAKKHLTEARSVADIEAEIAKLQQELADAKAAEKKASYGGKFPGEVWYWDMYINPGRKGTWTSIDNDTVFETEEDALDGAWTLLGELEDEGELRGDPDDYTIDAIKIPISKVKPEVLKGSGLEHLIPNDAKVYPVICCDCHKSFKISKEDKDKNLFKCDHCGVSLRFN